jgi:DNA-binding SARP family transcriptional activator
MLQLELLGHPKIRLDGELLQIPSSKSQALFFYLALNERPYTRTTLAGLLWGGKSESNARRNLRVELTKLRRHLDRYLIVSHSTVGFDHGQQHWLDVSDLRVAARDLGANFAQAKRAADLMRG